MTELLISVYVIVAIATYHWAAAQDRELGGYPDRVVYVFAAVAWPFCWAYFAYDTAADALERHRGAR